MPTRLTQTGAEVQDDLYKIEDIDLATEEKAGLMSPEDKTKLDNIDAEIPTKLSDLEDDSTHRTVTDTEKQTWNNKSDFSGRYQDLTGRPYIPQRTSDLVNNSGFITRLVDDLANYYLKSEVYTKAEVAALISSIQGFSVKVVNVLPTASAETMRAIYLVPSAEPQTGNTKDEWITVEDNGAYRWEQIGSTAISLDGYVTDEELTTALRGYVTSAAFATAMAGKQNVIGDLSEIRAGAQAGARAYQMPSAGIPATDLSEAVRGSLDKANSAVQEDDLEEALEGKADKEGIYPGIISGSTAAVLKTSEEEFTTKDLGGTSVDGPAMLKEVKGRSLVWNQLFNYSSISTGSAYSLLISSGKQFIKDHVFAVFLQYSTDADYASRVITVRLSRASFTYGDTINVQTDANQTQKSISFLCISKDSRNKDIYISLYTSGNENHITFSTNTIKVFDLTQMFGAGNEPATVEEFEAMFQEEYYDYNEGEIISNKTTELRSKDANSEIKGTLPLNLTTITGKLNGEGESVVIFPEGMRSAGTAYDSLIVDEDGYARKVVVRMGQRAYDAADDSDTTVITDGTNTVYQLATPLEYTLDAPVYVGFNAYAGGTLEQLPQNGSAPTTAPFRAVMSLPVAAAGEANVIEIIKVNGTAQTVTDKAVNITVPTALSSLSEDATHRVVTDEEKTVWNNYGKNGVISQTQTWSGSATSPQSYAMSNLVYGLIPQSNIDLYEAAGATFNATTGYFELNGLTDISYQEMKAIYNNRQTFGFSSNTGTTADLGNAFRYGACLCRTLVFATTFTSSFSGLGFGNCQSLLYSSFCEVIDLQLGRPLSSSGNYIAGARIFQGATKLHTILGRLIPVVAPTYWFGACYSLVTIYLFGLKFSVDISDSPNLSVSSVLYMINNAGTANFTITLHADVYARATADTDVQTALAAHTNVSLASA